MREGVPQILIETLFLVRSLQQAKLNAFCILPTHVHLILSPGKNGLSSFMHSFKTNSSKNARNHLSSVQGKDPQKISCFSGWQDGFHDERIQTGKQCGAAMAYVQGNAAKHRIVKEIAEWPWSSIHFEEFLDSMEMWTE